MVRGWERDSIRKHISKIKIKIKRDIPKFSTTWPTCLLYDSFFKNNIKNLICRSWKRKFIKGWLKIVWTVLHTYTHVDISDETGHLCSKNDNRFQFSSSIPARTRTVSQSFVLSLRSIMIINTLVQSQFYMYIQGEFHIVLCWVFFIKYGYLCLNVFKASYKVEIKPWYLWKKGIFFSNSQ